MKLFESLLCLLMVAAVLMRVSRRVNVPYPSMLALAGAGVAAVPFVPNIEIDPKLALALFIPPAIFDAAFDTAPRDLRRLWLPLFALVVVAVLLTTAAVTWVAWMLAALPLAACVVLGAIVAPPDAAAANAALSQLNLPRRTMAVLQGESLLNDAVALLIFAIGMSLVAHKADFGAMIPHLLIAAPGGVVFGLAAGFVFLRFRQWFAGAMSARIVEFCGTWAVWIIADAFELSAILAIVAFAMYLGRYAPDQTSARDRVHSYAVWDAIVFVLNVLAFLLMGLQARVILSRLSSEGMGHALLVAGAVLLTVVLVRFAWVMLYGTSMEFVMTRFPNAVSGPKPNTRVGLLVSWCGMRGLVTLATAFALPEGFPGRDIVVLSAFVVVFGTLVLQGCTIVPLIRLLGIKADLSLRDELVRAREQLVRAALDSMSSESGPAADALRTELEVKQQSSPRKNVTRIGAELSRLRRKSLAAQRDALAKLRARGDVEEDVYQQLLEQLDWQEVATTPYDQRELEES